MRANFFQMCVGIHTIRRRICRNKAQNAQETERAALLPPTSARPRGRGRPRSRVGHALTRRPVFFIMGRTVPKEGWRKAAWQPCRLTRRASAPREGRAAVGEHPPYKGRRRVMERAIRSFSLRTLIRAHPRPSAVNSSLHSLAESRIARGGLPEFRGRGRSSTSQETSRQAAWSKAASLLRLLRGTIPFPHPSSTDPFAAFATCSGPLRVRSCRFTRNARPSPCFSPSRAFPPESARRSFEKVVTVSSAVRAVETAAVTAPTTVGALVNKIAFSFTIAVTAATTAFTFFTNGRAAATTVGAFVNKTASSFTNARAVATAVATVATTASIAASKVAIAASNVVTVATARVMTETTARSAPSPASAGSAAIPIAGTTTAATLAVVVTVAAATAT